MSMPKFPDSKDILTREEALNAIITSIAMEETALARILTAESEKIESALENLNWERKKDRELILRINQSAAQVIERIGDLQMVLKNKLRLVTDCLPCPPCPKPCPCPPIPPHPPKPKPCPPKPCKCISKFVADTKYAWSSCRTLQFCHKVCCEDGVRTTRINDEFVIVLPPSKRYDVDLSLRLMNQARTDTIIELRQISGDHIVFSKKYTATGLVVNISDKLTLFAEGKNDSYLSLRLQSKQMLEIKEAIIEINSR